MASFASEQGGHDGSLTFDEACAQCTGQKLLGPEARPFKSDRTVGDVHIGDLPIGQLDSSFYQSGAVCGRSHVSSSRHFHSHMFDNMYKTCAESRLGELPEPFSLRKILNVPYSIQIVILSCQPPTRGDPTGSYYHIFKHVYLHKNKIGAKECMDMCYGNPVKFEWGQSDTRGFAWTQLHDGPHGGGKQIRYWTIKPKFEKKITVDQHSREDGYRFIRECGPRVNNRNQFMEWTDEQVHTPGGKLEGWHEAKVKEALGNYMKGRQKRQNPGILAFHAQKLRWMVSGPCLGQNASHHAPTLDHLARAHQDRKVSRLQDSSVRASQIRDRSRRPHRPHALDCDRQTPRLLQGRTVDKV